MRKQNNLLFLSMLFLVPLFLATLLTQTSTPVQAHPLRGDTPTPTDTPVMPPRDTPTPETTEPPTQEPPSTSDPPAFTISLSCNLICGIEGQTFSVSVPIQAVHSGSGASVEMIISNTGSAHQTVSFDGEWQIYMTGPPQFNPAPAYPVNFPTSYPVLLGSVYADDSQQIVECPFSCEPPQEDPPDDLPETGILTMERLPSLSVLIVTVGILFIILGGIRITKLR